MGLVVHFLVKLLLDGSMHEVGDVVVEILKVLYGLDELLAL